MSYRKINKTTSKGQRVRELDFHSITLLIAYCLLLILSSCKQKDKVIQNPDVSYTCSMHPQVLQGRPGNCPICGMKLIPVENKKGPDADAITLSDQQIQLGKIHVDTIG